MLEALLGAQDHVEVVGILAVSRGAQLDGIAHREVDHVRRHRPLRHVEHTRRQRERFVLRRACTGRSPGERSGLRRSTTFMTRMKMSPPMPDSSASTGRIHSHHG